MVKIVKYATDVSAETGAVCTDCKKVAVLHVCFEDGSGASLCKSCWEEHVNEGDWITDSTQALLAS